MPHAELHRAALEFVNGCDSEGQPTLHEYLQRFPGCAPEIIDLVADYVILDALAGSAPDSTLRQAA